MKTYDLKDEQGRVFAFEINNSGIGRAGVGRVALSIPGARLLEMHVSWWGPDEFCVFDVGGVTFVAWEPWGDNSRYWIGPRPPHYSEQTDIVRSAFARHTPRLSNLSRVGVAAFAASIAMIAFVRVRQAWIAWTAFGLLGLGGVLIFAANWRDRRAVRIPRPAEPRTPASSSP